MNEQQYAKFSKKEFNLCDYLAIDRTSLANERTFLAYLRTALTVFIAGVTFIRFFDSILIEIIGWIFVPVSIATFLIGIIRFKKFKKQVFKISD